MSWAYLVDVKWKEAKYAQGLSLLSFLRGESASPSDQIVENAERGDLDADLEIYEQITSRERSIAFICRLRQMKLVDGWEDLFRILLSIDQALDERRGIIAQKRCAFFGLHEFIGWLFQKTKVPTDDTRRYRVTRSATNVFHPDQSSRFSLMVMETVFSHGVDGRMVFPCGTGPTLEGRPLWHAVLLEIIPFVEWDSLPTSLRHWRAGAKGNYDWPDMVAEVMELWLRHGANAHARFRLSETGEMSGLLQEH
ncbi:hypothetical protein CHU98_g9601 [Xylaria longipes]|nr:hypothetical protein CHU98_g9601 [Xylaria longipes]